MTKAEWIPGKNYEQGPTCSTCHMGATKTLKATHDVGKRISWTLRPAISEKIDEAAKKAGKKEFIAWEKRRSDMQLVCASCHAAQWVNNWYRQFDDLVVLYNEKFGKPATELMKMLITAKLVTPDIAFDDKIEWTYYLLWHHEGRRARHGAAMMGPDYTQWHGMFEVSQRFYTEFVPELRELIHQNKDKGGEKATAAKAVEAVEAVEARLEEILNSEMHRWFLGKMPETDKAARKKASEEFKKRYAQ
ncbi:multiheme c-type cytochrome [Bdellovibrionota bacterium FG-2]